MENDMYLSLALELYQNETWSYNIFEKRVRLYCKENGMNEVEVNAFLDRFAKKKEYSLDEKRELLSILKFEDGELKYGDVAFKMSEEMVQKFYEIETSKLSKKEIENFHDKAKPADNTVVEEFKEEYSDVIALSDTKKEEIVEDVKERLSEEKESDEKKIGNITIDDIVNNNYTADDLLGVNIEDSDELFETLVNGVNKKSFDAVVASLTLKMGPLYARRFVEQWSKINPIEEVITEKSTADKEEVVHEEEPVLKHLPFDLEKKEETLVTESDTKEDIKEETLVNPETIDTEKKQFTLPSNWMFYEEDEKENELPITEEEFEKQDKVITSPEADSNVVLVNASSERIEKLKKGKYKVINAFLKTAMVVVAYKLLHPLDATIFVGGYMAFAASIRSGAFDPKSKLGKAIKSGLEKIMYIGIPKEELEKGGRTK